MNPKKVWENKKPVLTPALSSEEGEKRLFNPAG
jgi:hypothetical protein